MSAPIAAAVIELSEFMINVMIKKGNLYVTTIITAGFVVTQRALACFEAGALGRLFAVTSSISYNNAFKDSTCNVLLSFLLLFILR